MFHRTHRGGRTLTVRDGLSWTPLVAIGTVESNNGASTAPGVDSGTNAVGAEGPMQFEPATFVEYAAPVPVGGVNQPSPYDEIDAVYGGTSLVRQWRGDRRRRP
jgi:hypothetical protein